MFSGQNSWTGRCLNPTVCIIYVCLFGDPLHWKFTGCDNIDLKVRRREIGQEDTGHICTSGREELNQFSVPKCYVWHQTKAFYLVDFQRRNYR